MDISLSVGRIFRRTNNDGIGLLGVVLAPEELDTEALHTCSVQGGALMVDCFAGQVLTDVVGRDVPAEILQQEDASSLFYHRYRSDPSGAQQFFFRQATLPSSEPGMKWCYIAGARRLDISQLPEDGLYELGAVPRRIPLPADFGAGMTLGSLLREPIWGPGGAYGLAHSLEVGAFSTWVEEDRARNARRDPEFARYVQAMAAHGETPLFYTRAQLEEREALVRRVVREMLLDEEGLPRPRG